MKTRPAALLILVLTLLTAHGAPVQWSTLDGGNGHFYELIGNYLDPAQRWNWHQSKLMAEALGGHLVTIASAGENQFLIDTFLALNLPTWIGLTDSESYGGAESFGKANPQTDGWRWVTGEPVTFGGWSSGQPDNLGDEDFALIGSQWGDHHFWNDAQGNDHAPFFVEFEATSLPDSSPWAMTLALACVAGARFLESRKERLAKTFPAG